jgi:hypothetical protein
MIRYGYNQTNQEFYFKFWTSTSCCSWCFTISIRNEWGSCRTCRTAYRITSVRHEAADAESAYPMPLAMSCLFPGTGGVWRQLSRHKHRAKGSLSGNSSEANCLGERRRKVVKVASLSTLEVSTEMNKGTSVLYCG